MPFFSRVTTEPPLSYMVGRCDSSTLIDELTLNSWEEEVEWSRAFSLAGRCVCLVYILQPALFRVLLN